MVRPKKHLGQHFLTDLNTARRIVDSMDYGNSVNVLEIGPGKGVLTKFLLEKHANLKLVELDAESVEYLHSNFDSSQMEVIKGDVLKLDFSEIFGGQSFSVIGNFPYNISSQIVFKVLEQRSFVNELSGMFQREMAKRICSPPGNKDYGILSVLTQAYFDSKYLFTVNEGVFFPPPKVKSGVLKLIRKETPPDIDSFKRFSNLVKTAFQQRRKQLKNTLKPLFPDGFNHKLLTQRPEQLHWTEFLDIYKEMPSIQKS
jgi:16S rRNA (adenine1518-N6/adenine1519-N6)-dimethyltransferase